MNRLEERLAYEEKMDHISEQLEELILDAMLSALQRIQERNIRFDEIANGQKTNDISF